MSPNSNVSVLPRLTATTPAAVPTRPVSRDRYIDSLRAFALFRIVVYHLFGWAWLTVAFPSIPIMFALAGSLVAGSLDRSPMNPWTVLRRRLRRLLPPLWMLGAVAIPLMLLHHWSYDADLGTGSALSWQTLLLWIVPISDPPGSAWGADWTVPLWYIRAYLWFLLLSPALLWVFRRWPLRTIAVPFIGLVAATTGIWDLMGATGDVLLTIMTYGACWMLGFAHHDNLIRRIAFPKVVAVALVLMAIGLGYALTHQSPISGYDLDEIPLAVSLWGTGAVLLLLRFYPDFSWLARIPILDKLVASINSRAMTIYLWNNPAIFLSAPLAQLFSFTRQWDDGGILGKTQQFLLAWLLIAAAIVLFGWVEDVAAKKRVRFNPWPRSRPLAENPVRRQGRVRLPRATIWVAGVSALALVIPLGVLSGWKLPSGTDMTDNTIVAAQPAANTATKEALPTRVVAGYWQGWGKPAIRLADVPANYNVIIASFAVGDASGKVTFSQSVQSKSSFVSDVDRLQQAGRKVLLSVGGANDGGLKITTDKERKAFLKSVTKIIDANHFHGIDWDFEHGLSPVQIAKATRALKSQYGSQFAVAMAPTLTKSFEDQQLDLAARIKDDLDMVAPQFYNGGSTDPTWIINRALEWAEVVGQEKVAMGFMTTKTPLDTGIQTPDAVCRIWDGLREQAPRARGLMTWSINLDKTTGYDFAKNCAATVGLN